MSNQTGIVSNDELLEFFGKCREGKARDKFRLVKVIIVNEQLALDEAKETKGNCRNYMKKDSQRRNKWKTQY